MPKWGAGGVRTAALRVVRAGSGWTGGGRPVCGMCEGGQCACTAKACPAKALFIHRESQMTDQFRCSIEYLPRFAHVLLSSRTGHVVRLGQL